MASLTGQVAGALVTGVRRTSAVVIDLATDVGPLLLLERLAER